MEVGPWPTKRFIIPLIFCLHQAFVCMSTSLNGVSDENTGISITMVLCKQFLITRFDWQSQMSFQIVVLSGIL